MSHLSLYNAVKVSVLALEPTTAGKELKNAHLLRVKYLPSLKAAFNG